MKERRLHRENKRVEINTTLIFLPYRFHIIPHSITSEAIALVIEK
jgi:hypothetical protein